MYELCAVVQHHALGSGSGGGGGGGFSRSVASLESGHYTAYRRLQLSDSPDDYDDVDDNDNDQLDRIRKQQQQQQQQRPHRWVHISDATVVPVKVEQVLHAEAYLLFYQRVDAN